jgi:ubiquinone/menaquinone biosynthesis C-methylase UbiE
MRGCTKKVCFFCKILRKRLHKGLYTYEAEKTPIPVKLIEMDAEKLDFPDYFFDKVVIACVFCSVPDPIQGLKEIKRVLKPDEKVLMLEHMRSEKPFVGKLMDVVNPFVVRL